MLQIPKTKNNGLSSYWFDTKKDPNNKTAGVNTLIKAAVTNTQYLILFIPTILPHLFGLSSPLTFSHFVLVVLAGAGTVYPDRLTARVGDRPLRWLRYNVSVRISFIGLFDSWSISTLHPTRQNHTMQPPGANGNGPRYLWSRPIQWTPTSFFVCCGYPVKL